MDSPPLRSGLHACSATPFPAVARIAGAPSAIAFESPLLTPRRVCDRGEGGRWVFGKVPTTSERRRRPSEKQQSAAPIGAAYDEQKDRPPKLPGVAKHHAPDLGVEEMLASSERRAAPTGRRRARGAGARLLPELPPRLGRFPLRERHEPVIVDDLVREACFKRLALAIANSKFTVSCSKFAFLVYIPNCGSDI